MSTYAQMLICMPVCSGGLMNFSAVTECITITLIGGRGGKIKQHDAAVAVY